MRKINQPKIPTNEVLRAVATARAEYANDDIEIDDYPAVTRSDTGYWVAAWVHVREEDL